MANYIKAPSVLLYPLKELWISADCEDHGYPAIDLGWWDYDPSIPEDSGRNPRLYAMNNGIVTQVVNSHPDEPDWEGYGNYIVIEYPLLNMWSLFAHIKKNSFLVKVGDLVQQGDPVCRMGNSGYSYGNHDHLEVGYGHFVRHGGVDPTKVVYCTEWHIVDEDTERDYKLLHLTITPVDKDVTVNQVHVFGDDLRIRKSPVDGEVVGFAQQGYYDFTDSLSEGDYIWCKVDDYWIAGNTDVSEICRATFIPTDPDPTVNQCEVSITDLRIRLEPSTSSTIMGYCPPGFYTITDTAEAEGMIWFSVCGYWIACVDGVRYIPAEDDPQKEIEELKAEIERLNGVIAEKDERIEEQAEIIRKDVEAFTEIERISARMIPE